jgi:NADPH2:quinone reductase
VLNTPGLPSVDSSVQAVKDFGTILDILGHFPTQPGFQAKGLTFKSVFAERPIMTGDRASEVGEILTTAAELVEGGTLRPLLDDRRFTFATIGEAHRTAEHGRPTGKVVVTNPWRGRLR